MRKNSLSHAHTQALTYAHTGISMRSPDLLMDWKELAERLEIKLPDAYLEFLAGPEGNRVAWKFLTTDESLKLKTELDIRFDYPGREWRGIPFARSTVSEDVVCFDLTGGADVEALVIPIRDWHGPRWEYAGGNKTFVSWLAGDSKGHLK